VPTSKRTANIRWRPITKQWWYAFLYWWCGYRPPFVGKCIFVGNHYNRYSGEDGTQYLLDKDSGKLWITGKIEENPIATA
jgi:hypothetical protein